MPKPGVWPHDCAHHYCRDLAACDPKPKSAPTTTAIFQRSNARGLERSGNVTFIAAVRITARARTSTRP